MDQGHAEEEERLDRLAGDGERGGGLPLPLLFAAILEELLDRGSATTARLTEITADRLDFKTQRVMAVWGSWEALTDAVLQQMAGRQIISSSDGAWRTGEAFGEGKNLVIIPKRKDKKHAAVSVTVYGHGERERRSGVERREMTITSANRELRENGRGLRSVNPKRVELLRQSVVEFGRHDDVFPVLQTPDGRIIDGRHRLAAFSDWERRVVRSATEEEKALQASLVANRSAPWTDREWGKLSEERGAVGGQQSRKERADAELLSSHDTHKVIADRLKMSHHTISNYCGQLRQLGKLPSCLHERRADGKTQHRASQKPPRIVDDPALNRDAEQLIVTGDRSAKRLAEQHNVSRDTADRALDRAEGRLEERRRHAAAFSIPPGNAPASAGPAEHAHTWQPVHMLRCSCGALVEVPPS